MTWFCLLSGLFTELGRNGILVCEKHATLILDLYPYLANKLNAIAYCFFIKEMSAIVGLPSFYVSMTICASYKQSDIKREH